MSFRDELARIIANDPRYTIDAYIFILEALNHARHQKLKAKGRDRDKALSTPRVRGKRPSPSSKKAGDSGHVSGRELCEAVRRLGLRQFGLLAATVFSHWGVRSTSDIGDIVYHLIEAGDLEKTPSDSRSDFDNVYDFDTALRPKSLLAHEDTA
jgi:uncharacterized repeat protein (TIGR04138 family)